MKPGDKGQRGIPASRTHLTPACPGVGGWMGSGMDGWGMGDGWGPVWMDGGWRMDGVHYGQTCGTAMEECGSCTYHNLVSLAAETAVHTNTGGGSIAEGRG